MTKKLKKKNKTRKRIKLTLGDKIMILFSGWTTTSFRSKLGVVDI
jgi:translation initiation factor IF-1